MSPDLFDCDAVFDDDYLHFYGKRLEPAQVQSEVEVLRRLLELEAGQEVLDLACGHGRIALPLARLGCRVTGLDRSRFFLDRAQADATAACVAIDWVEGDMRSLPWTDRFDRVLIWFSAFGYFDDEENREVLHQACRALRPGGRLVLDQPNRDTFLARKQAVMAVERDEDLMLDRVSYDPLTGRTSTERTIVRDGRSRRVSFSIRLAPFTELRTWLEEAGFSRVEAFGSTGEPLTAEDWRLVVVAHR